MGESAGDDPCVFCEIVARRIPAYIVYEDDSTLAFLDLFPFTRGHLLVIPKRHGARLTDLPFEDQTALIRSLDEMCRRTERLTPNYNVSLNAGRPAGQVVFHVHLHLIPRYGEANPFQHRTRTPIEESEAQALMRELSTP